MIRAVMELAGPARGGAGLVAVNEQIAALTNIDTFFHDPADIDAFLATVSGGVDPVTAPGDMGDHQTPPGLAARACRVLLDEGIVPDILVEPTCGDGNLVVAAITAFPSLERVTCVEIQPAREWRCKLAMLRLIEVGVRLPRVTFHRADVFAFDFSPLNVKGKHVLVLGNPPWVTNAALQSNLPPKRNIKHLAGLDALTGKSNFDIAESIIVALARAFTPGHATLAMLCKDTVIRNIVRDAAILGLKVSNMRARAFDAMKEFGVSAAASFFVASIGSTRHDLCVVSSLGEGDSEPRSLGWTRGKFVFNVAAYENARHVDGTCPFEWRQGLKHDLARVMVLKRDAGGHVNGAGERVDLDDEMIFPLVKSSDLHNTRVVTSTRYHVIVPQRALGQDTSDVAKHHPKTWQYLHAHREAFDARKSRVYKGKPLFSVFGIGEYSFKPFKVGISGFYKEPRFSLVPPVDGKPVMMDDTCYFLSFDEARDAAITWFLLEQRETKEFLTSVVFLDAKRPYTKEVLGRVDLEVIARAMGLHERAGEIDLAARDAIDIPVRQIDVTRYLDVLERRASPRSRRGAT